MADMKCDIMSFEEAIDLAILARQSRNDELFKKAHEIMFNQLSPDKLKKWINSGTISYEKAVEVVREFQKDNYNKSEMEPFREYIDFLKLYVLCNAPDETYRTWCDDTFAEIEPLASNGHGKPYSL
jgi:hypothetical protein